MGELGCFRGEEGCTRKLIFCIYIISFLYKMDNEEIIQHISVLDLKRQFRFCLSEIDRILQELEAANTEDSRCTKEYILNEMTALVERYKHK